MMSAPTPSAAPTCITWQALRPEPLPTLRHARYQPGTLALQSPEPSPGIACIAFGIGPGGANWLGRLAASDWFAGLAPRPADIAAAETQSTTPSPWPSAPLAAVAITAEAGSAEHALALALVVTLRAERDAHGCRKAVTVTFDSASPDSATLELELRRQGAFVIRPAPSVSGDHLHHLPLRAATYPRHGRLVCVDLADYLVTWSAGGRAHLHVMPALLATARSILDRLDVTSTVIAALNLDLHFDPDDPGNPLIAIDQLATCCQKRLLPHEDAPSVFTTSERLDGMTDTFDLLLIEHSLSESQLY